MTTVHHPPSTVGNRDEWNSIVASLPHSHILQSWEWGEFKSRTGWSARRLVWRDEAGHPIAAAQILQRPLHSAVRFLPSVFYIPKGPLLDWSNAILRARVLDDLQTLARRERAIQLKIDPDVCMAMGTPGAEVSDAAGGEVIRELESRDWRLSAEQIQFRNTVVLNLTRPEADVLAAMKQKTRYNIRLAERKGVRVRPGSAADLDLLYRMYAETSVRDGFVIRSADYYREAWGRFITVGLAQPFIAEVEGEAVSALVLFKFARTAWYMYGMSREAQREKMPNHLLQWEAMRWAKANGAEAYDFWGAPDVFDESDSMWGVWKFKEGFGGQVHWHIGAWDYAPSPLFYRLYTVVLPRVLNVLRRRGKAQTQAAMLNAQKGGNCERED